MSQAVRRLLLISIALISSLTACATPNSLKASTPAGRQPVMTKAGPAPEKSGDRLIAKVAGAESDAESRRLKQLTDSIRESLSSPLVAGNKATLLVDGPATFVAIDKA